MERPLCKCHGEPMLKNGTEWRWRKPFPKWRCAVAKRAIERDRHWNKGGRERRLRQYAERKAAGICVRCGNTALSALCWECLNEQEARDAVRF